jgi:hypothetical protein
LIMAKKAARKRSGPPPVSGKPEQPARPPIFLMKNEE